MLVLLSAVACFGPLSFYLIALGQLHRRIRVTVWSGRTDFLALLAGLSGFLLILGVAWLLAAQSNARFLVRGNATQIRAVFDEERNAWALTVVGYLIAMVVPVSLTLYARRSVLAVFNIDWADLERAIDETTTELGLTTTRFGRVWSDGRDLVSAEMNWTSHFAAVKLLTHDPRLCQELELGLRKKLAAVEGPQGAIGLWLYTAGLTCLGMAAASLLMNFYFVYLLGSN